MSREKQIDKLCNDLNKIFDEEYRERRIITAYHTAKGLYEQDYRKQSEGEWVDQYQGKYDNQLYKCSECGETAFHDETRWFLTHYCPNCGAKMKGGAE